MPPRPIDVKKLIENLVLRGLSLGKRPSKNGARVLREKQRSSCTGAKTTGFTTFGRCSLISTPSPYKDNMLHVQLLHVRNEASMSQHGTSQGHLTIEQNVKINRWKQRGCTNQELTGP